jgi:hypothetical protein
VLLK